MVQQQNLCIKDTLGLTKCPDYQGVLIFWANLHAMEYFGKITKCPDYAGVLIFKCFD